MILGTCDLINELYKLKQDGKKIVFTDGCFDLLHIGHLHCLQDAKALGDVVLVAVATDTEVKGMKGGNRPIIVEAQRLELVDNLKCVDYAMLSTYQEDVIKHVVPDFYFKGSEYASDIPPPRVSETWTKWMQMYGGKCVVSTRPVEMRTTNIIRDIKAQADENSIPCHYDEQRRTIK